MRFAQASDQREPWRDLEIVGDEGFGESSGLRAGRELQAGRCAQQQIIMLPKAEHTGLQIVLCNFSCNLRLRSAIVFAP